VGQSQGRRRRDNPRSRRCQRAVAMTATTDAREQCRPTERRGWTTMRPATTRKSWPNQQKINRSMLIGASQWPISPILQLSVKTNNLLPIFLLIRIVQWPNQQNVIILESFWIFHDILEYFIICK
jgi:hypothetical protein